MQSDTFLWQHRGSVGRQSGRFFSWFLPGVVLSMAWMPPPQLFAQACVVDADCDDLNPCTDDVCFGAFSPICIHVSNCSDGIVCNGLEICCEDPLGCGGVPLGSCQPGSPIVCPPGTTCFENPGGGFMCNECQFDSDCADPAPPCLLGVCINGTCQSQVTPGACDDGDLCTTGDTCIGGVCTGTPTDCIAQAPECMVGTCNPANGQCQFTPFPDGTFCDDNNLCTAVDRCQGGVCVGGPPDCNDPLNPLGCIDLELLLPAGQPPIQVGDIVNAQLWAFPNAGPFSTTLCSGIGRPLGVVDVVFSWDPNVFKLLGTVDPCDGTTLCTDINCNTAPVSQYDWLVSNFPNDCGLGALNADCDPTTCCNPFTFAPFNDGNARYNAIPKLQCDSGVSSVPAPPACVFGTGLQIVTLQFQALVPTMGLSLPTEVKIESCIAQTRTLVGSGLTPGLEVTGTLGAPLAIPVACASSADCPPGQACVTGSCIACPPPTVEVAGPRYLKITPFPGPDPVGLLVTGVDPLVSCVSGYVQVNGNTLPATPQTPPIFQTPAQWGTIAARGSEVVSAMTYQVQLDCDPANPGTSLSSPVTATLWLGGDVDHNNDTNILDVVRILNAFRGSFGTVVACTSDADCSTVPPNFSCNIAGRCVGATLENVDVIGVGGGAAGCLPERDISILDVVSALNFFKGQPDPCLGAIACP